MREISRKRTGREWGQKKPFAVVRKTPEGVEVEADFWDGPTEPGETGAYERVRWFETRESYRPSSCSFDAALRKAVGL